MRRSIISRGWRPGRGGGWAFALMVAVAAVSSLKLWGDAFRDRDSEPWSVRAFYRGSGVGDIQYFALISQLARCEVGEAMVKEEAGRGIISFPIASLAVHAACVRALGARGYVAADLILSAASFLCLNLLLRAAGMSRRWSGSAGLLLICLAQPRILARAFPELSGPWEYRIPRPLVTTTFLVLAMALMMRVVRSRRTLASPRIWAALALATSLLVQSDFHAMVTVMAMAALIAAFALVRGRRRSVVMALGVGALVGLASVSFYLAQRLGENGDVPRRFGLFPVPRSEFARFLGVYPLKRRLLLIQLAITAAVAVVSSLAGGRAGRPGRLRVIAVLAATQVVAFLALPLTVAVLGKSIQIYHFYERFTWISLFCDLACLVIVGDVLARSAGARFAAASRALAPLVAGLSVASCLGYAAQSAIKATPMDQHLRRDVFDSPPDYRRDFAALAAELGGPRYARSEVIATFDHQVACWWVAFHDGYLFNPDPFLTTLPDATIERRLMQACKIAGMSADDFARFIESETVENFLLSCDKYQASAAYRFSNRDDYEPSVLAGIDATSIYTAWNLRVPLSEKARLLRAYGEARVDRASLPRLDLVVSSKAGKSPINPPTEEFSPTYENPTFRVWVRK